MMIRGGRFNLRSWVALAAVCGGGLLPGSCAVRTKRALVDGSKTFLSDVLLNPENLADLPFDELAENLAGGEGG